MAGESGLSAGTAGLADAVAAGLPDGPLLVALSGGADSAALAWAVASVRKDVRAVSIDHRLPASPELMEAARRIASILDLDHRVVTAERRAETETELRELRLAALEGEAGPGEWVLTGHTRDDLAETVLGNILRGSGTRGLAGIPDRRAPFARPMLGVSRERARAAADELGLPYVDDPQNDDLTVRRNVLRHQTIPALSAAHNPRLVESLARLGAAASHDDRLLEARAARVGLVERGGALLIPAAPLQTLPTPISSRIAGRALRVVGGGHPGTAEEVDAVLAAAAGDRFTIRGGVEVMREGPFVALVREEPATPEPTRLGSNETDWGEWRFFHSRQTPVGRFAAVVERDEDLVVRAAVRRDRIAIGPTGSKSVFDAMAEAGVPDRIRARWPVIVADGTICWIPGVRSAPVTEPAGRVLRAVRRQA